MPESRLVVLDACVLVPAALCDMLLRVAAQGAYRLRWSAAILEEVRRTLVVNKLTSEQQALRRIAAMRRTFDRADVTCPPDLVAKMTNHPKDRHVLAVAVAAEAHLIVTYNLRHFPEHALAPFAIQARPPDAFLTNLFDVSPEVILRVIIEQAADLHHPPLTVDQVLDELAKHVPSFAPRVRDRMMEERP